MTEQYIIAFSRQQLVHWEDCFLEKANIKKGLENVQTLRKDQQMIKYRESFGKWLNIGRGSANIQTLRKDWQMFKH